MSLSNCFKKNYFWLPNKCIFKIALPLLFHKVSSLAKEFLFQRKTVSKLLKSFLFQRKDSFNSFLNPIWFQKLFAKQFENPSPFQKCYNFTFKKQKFCFTINKMFSNQSIWLDFSLKSFDFNLGAKSLSKIDFAFKNGLQMIYKAKSLRKDFVCNLPKNFSKNKNEFHKSSFKSFVLKRGFWKQSLNAKALPFKWEMIWNHFQN